MRAFTTLGTTLGIVTGMITLALGIGAAATTADAQENRGTMEQQMACTPDVFRLCGSEIPDSNRIVACLQQNIVQLRPACRAVFEANANLDQPPPPPPSRQRSVRAGNNLHPGSNLH